MEDDTKSADIAPNPNSNAKGKKGKPTKADAIVPILLFFAIGGFALFGWSRIEFTPLRVVLYTVASFSIGLGSFAFREELTHKVNPNYSLVLMSFILFAFFIYASHLTDISALRWLSIALAILFGFGALITLIVQFNEDKRAKPIVKRVLPVLLSIGLPLLFTWLFEQPIILLVIPLALIVLYNEYLTTTYLTKPTADPQSNPHVPDKGSIVVSTFRSIPRTLSSYRRPVYTILLLFSVVFCFIIIQQASHTYDFSIFYQAVAPAYFGILAIVIAFAVLVIRRDTEHPMPAHLRLPINGLAQMYVIFALVTVFGLLLGTDVTGEILTAGTKLTDILWPPDKFLHVCRLLVLQFSVSAFPVGLLYLYAMIQDFMTTQVGGSNNS